MTTIEPVILAFDTSSSACTAALFDGDGRCLGARDELIGRGHAERLVPMIAELLDGRSAAHVLVGVGPGSFTGIRVAIAAAHGLAIGWGAEVSGMSSLALLALSGGTDGEVAVAVTGGHGELFVQQFDGATGESTSELRNLLPADAARFATAAIVAGSGAAQLVDARGWGEAREAWPAASRALALPERLRTLAPRPLYARAPDARASGSCVMATPAVAEQVRIEPGTAEQIDEVMAVMSGAFGDEFGEAWTRSQLSGILPMAGVFLVLAVDRSRDAVVGFSLFRTVADESELLLIGVDPGEQRRGIGRLLLDDFVERARDACLRRVHLEVRDGNPAVGMYRAAGFSPVGRRRNYYHALSGNRYDAITLACEL